jgi:adenylate cyclase class 2
MLEIEIKVRVPDTGIIRDNILANGGTHSETLTEHDTYYNAPHRDFGCTDEALRLRRAGDRKTVTYKGPKDTILGSKVRKELNLEIQDARAFEEIITSLGFRAVAEVKKIREYYRCGDFTISLDQVDGLGSFSEIELITDGNAEEAARRIDAVAKKVGVCGERITASYLELLLSKQ